jgi:pantoate--beta-alanine ligase
MKIIRTALEIQQYCSKLKASGQKIGFIPTMGALHYGHLSLLDFSLAQCDITIISIFVNPSQFTESLDFKNYPRQESEDIIKIGKRKVDVLFIPSVDEIYYRNEALLEFNLEGLDEVLEGKWRPGHFKGVITVVDKLFKLIQPDRAYFGLKDFQQICIIKKMSKVLHPSIEIVGCDIIREDSGLAMSSRNALLTESEKLEAVIISKTLFRIRDAWKKTTAKELLSDAVANFNKSKLHLEYLEIVDADTLKAVSDNTNNKSVACIAAKCGNVRLIDNVILLP